MPEPDRSKHFAMNTRNTSKPSLLSKLHTWFLRALYHPAAGFAVLLGSLVLTGLAWNFSIQYSNDHALHNFNSQVREIEARISRRMDDYARLLQSGVALHHAKDSIDRTAWKRFVSTLDLATNYPGTQGIGVSLIVQPSELESHIAAVRREGYPDYSVHPNGDRSLYTSIVYLEPFDWRNKRAFGFDMYSEPMRRAAMDRATRSGRASISGPVKLVQETDQGIQAGLLMYLPIFASDVPETATASARVASQRGFVYAVLRGEDLMKNILANIGQEISLRIIDSSHSGITPIYEGGNSARNESSPRISVTREIGVYGQTWTLDIESAYGDSFIAEYWQSSLVGIFGLLVDFLLFYTIHLIGKQRLEADHRKQAEKLRQLNARLTRTNADLEESNNDLERASSDLNRFAYTASHEMKSPLRAICQLTEFVREDSEGHLPDSCLRHLDLIQARAARLGNLLENMMAYSRSGQESSQKDRLDVCHLVDEIVESVTTPESTEVQIDIDVPVVLTSTNSLRRVLTNLVDNAISHHDQLIQTIEIRARWCDGELKFEVSDDGPGIDIEARDRLFGLFEKMHSQDQQEGSGLGLSICAKLVRTNGGTIGFSDPGDLARGTTVAFSWKARKYHAPHFINRLATHRPVQTRPIAISLDQQSEFKLPTETKT